MLKNLRERVFVGALSKEVSARICVSAHSRRLSSQPAPDLRGDCLELNKVPAPPHLQSRKSRVSPASAPPERQDLIHTEKDYDKVSEVKINY